MPLSILHPCTYNISIFATEKMVVGNLSVGRKVLWPWAGAEWSAAETASRVASVQWVCQKQASKKRASSYVS